MFIMVFRKMLNNKWMVLCLLIGSVLTVGLVSSMPLYTRGILQRMLSKDLENFQLATSEFPGGYTVTNKYFPNTSRNDVDGVKAYRLFDEMIEKSLVPDYRLPVLASYKEFEIRDLDLMLERPGGSTNKTHPFSLKSISQLDKHITFVHGGMYKSYKENDTYEAILTEGAARKLEVLTGDVLLVSRYSEEKKFTKAFKIRVTGIFTVKDSKDPFWSSPLSEFQENMFIDSSLFSKEFMNEGAGFLSDVKWYYAFDYHKINLSSLSSLLDTYEAQKKWFRQYPGISGFKMPGFKILEEYGEREKQLRLTLWVLMLSILITLGFYIFMTSQLIIKFDQNDIAVFKSRGTSPGQIFLIYLFQSLLIGGAALITGPPLGLFICRMVGASNGFLEFVQRRALPVGLDIYVYTYALAAVAFFIITMLVPAILSSRISIVEHKRQKVRKNARVVWQRLYLDFILIGLSVYGYYRYKSQQKLIDLAYVKGTEMPVDPLLFLVSTFFILGTGFLFLRIYPHILRFVFNLGKNKWSTGAYISFISVERSKGEEQFLMLFIILTMALGIFNASSSHTINRNIEDSLRYKNGADIVLNEKWMHNKSDNFLDVVAPGTLIAKNEEDAFRWIEPDYRKYNDIKGVLSSTRVFTNQNAIVKANGSTINNIGIMGIVPGEFGKVAWSRPRLMEYPFNSYLNLLTKSPKSFLLSRSFERKYKLKVGDSIDISWGEQNPLNGVVAAFIDYWPGSMAGSEATDDSQSAGSTDNQPKMLVVANLNYIHSFQIVEPYAIWIKKASDTADKEIDEAFKEKKIEASNIVYTNQDIIKEKNDPMLQGTNGTLTLGFLVTILISAIGFLIYWILSIKSRVLQFGIFRAMGMSFKKLIGIIAIEQLLITVVPVFAGLGIGTLSGRLFIPLLQIIYGSYEQAIPFKITSAGGDYEKIIIAAAVMLVTGMAALGKILSNIRMDQAVKLGED